MSISRRDRTASKSTHTLYVYTFIYCDIHNEQTLYSKISEHIIQKGKQIKNIE